MNSLSQRISDRITYLEKKREADREYLMTYGTRAVRDTETKANAVIAQGKFLEGMGMAPEKVDYVVTKYGIPALSELYNAVKSNEYTREDLNGGELLNNMVTFADDYETDDLSWEDFTRRSFGLYKDADKSTPANRASGWFHSLLGLNPRTADPDTYIGGYTEADIRRIMGTSTPTLTSAPTYDIYGTLPKRYTPTQMAAYKSTIEDSLDTYAENWLAANAIKEGQTYSDDFMTTYNAIEKAAATKSDSSYAYLAQVIPDAKQYILSIDKNSRGVVQQAAKQGFMSQGFLNIFEGAKVAAADTAGGIATEVTTLPSAAKAPEPAATDVSLLQSDYELAKKDDPNIAPLDDLPRFNTDEEFIAAGVKFGVVGVGTAAEIKTNTSVTASTDQQDDLEATSDKTIDLGDTTGGTKAVTEINIPKRSSWTPSSTPTGEGGKNLTTDDVLFDMIVYDRQNEPLPDSDYIDEGFTQEQIDRVKKEVDAAFKATDLGDMTGAPGFREERSSLVAKTTSALEKGQATRKFIAEGVDAVTPEAETVISTMANAVAAGIDALADAEDFTAGLFGYEESTLGGTMTTTERSQRYRDLAQSMRNQAEEVFTMGFSEYMRSLTGKEVPEAVVAEVKENLDTDELILRAFDTKANQGLISYIRAAQRRAYKPDSLEDSDEKPIYSIEDIKAYAENRLGARERQAMEDRIRDDARQFLQDEKSFPQPLPTIIVEKLEDDIVEEAKVDVEVMRIVQQLDKKGETPSRKDIEDLKKTLELNQVIDTETQELYRGPISGKTLPEKLDDIYNFYTGEESDYDPRAIGTVGFRDLGLRDTTDDVRPPRNKGPELGDQPDSLENPESELGFFTKPRNMMIESMLTRGKRVPADELEGPEGEESGLEVSTGSMYTDMAELIERVHGGGSKFTQLADDIADAAIRGDKVKVADITRLINATEKLRSTKTRSEVLRSLYAMRDRLNKR